MTAKTLVRLIVVVVPVLLVAGCWSAPDPAPSVAASPVALPTVAPAGAHLACGIDRDSLAVATGFEVGTADGELTVVDGVGSGECVVDAAEGEYTTKPLIWVSLYSASSPEAVQARARIDGDPTIEAPALILRNLDGYVGGALEAEDDRMTLGSTASVFFGDTMVEVVSTRGDSGRHSAADIVALVQQVAASYGLDDASPTPAPTP